MRLSVDINSNLKNEFNEVIFFGNSKFKNSLKVFYKYSLNNLKLNKNDKKEFI